MKSTLFAVLCALIFSTTALAVSQNMTVSGRLLKPDGTVLSSSSVTFNVKVIPPSGTCNYLYDEQLTVDLSASNGLFELALGTGTVNFGTLTAAFGTSGSIACQNGVNYSPAAGDTVSLRIKFYDSTEAAPSWRTFTSVIPVRSVPHAMYAGNSEKLGDKTADDFLGKPTGCSAGNFVGFDGTSTSCSPLSTNSITSGTFADAMISSLSVDKLINGTNKYFNYKPNNTACAQGEILTYSTTANGWVCSAANAGTVTSVSATTPLVNSGTVAAPVIGITQATGSSSGYLSNTDWNSFNSKQSANAELTGIASLALTGIVQRTGSGTYTALGLNPPLLVSGSNIGIANIPASLITSGTFADAMISSLSVDKLINGTSKYLNYKPNNLACVNGEILTYSTAMNGWVCGTAAVGTVTSVTTTTPLVNSGTAVAPVLGINQASGSVSGFLSTSDWNTFNNKQAASAELSGIASLALTGIVQRTAAGTYTALAINAPLAASGSSLSISNIPAGLITTGTLSTTVLPSTVVLAGGNSLGADLSVGTNDTQGVSLRTGGTNRLSIDSAGTVSMTGAVVMRNVANSTATIDFKSGNLQSTTLSCQSFSLNNMKDGGSYSFAVKGSTSATCAFTAYSDAGTTALTVHLPTDHAPTIASTHTLYTFLVMGTDVYVSWMPGL